MNAVLSHRNFADYFKELWGSQTEPFAWQSSLVRRVLDDTACPEAASATGSSSGALLPQDRWPEAIALPTGAGKTACLDIAVFALAAQASGQGALHAVTAPRRIFFVVDRRIIVDEAHVRAKRLAKKLNSAQDGILKVVANHLRRLACGGETEQGDEFPLAAHSLRGGMYRSEAWARNPLQPTIVTSTVDQIGSRLLFRAYGRRNGIWPVYAGLIANDSLILLDEAHCAQPFLQTLQAVRKYRGWAEFPLRRCFYPVMMSATPPPDVTDVFRDSSDEGRNPNHPLGQRQLARKPASLRRVKIAPDKNATDEAALEVSAVDKLARELADAALRLVRTGLPAVVVFGNRVATVRRTKALLEDPDASEAEVILLTGRMRAVDRETVATRLEQLDLHSSRSAGRTLEKPVIVVATQTLEVGADLDFDGLVTECASLDALRQRFGRLNRMGRRYVDSRAEILIRSDHAKSRRGSKDDPVYGKALTGTWKWLQQQTRLAKPRGAAGGVDFGIAAMEELLDGPDDLTHLNAPSKSAPVMLPAHVDCWAQTCPAPTPSPDVVPFLRGPETGVPDVHVCWRADLDLSRDDLDAVLESLRLCPPCSGETLPVPIGMFRRWLAGAAAEDRSADIPHAEDEGETDTGGGTESGGNTGRRAFRRIVRWRGARTSPEDITAIPRDVRPGDVVVIPTRHPGPWRRLGDVLLPNENTCPDMLDVGDRSHRLARAKPILRLHPRLVSVWPDPLTAKPKAQALLENLEQRYEDDPDEIVDAVKSLLNELSASETPAGWEWLTNAAHELKKEFSTSGILSREIRIVGPHCLVLVGRRRVPHLSGEADTFSDEDDISSSGISHRGGRPVTLHSHLSGVWHVARRHALGCGLRGDLGDAVARAGLLHDLGKADPRFQSMLRGGLPWLAGQDELLPLAKSSDIPKTRAARRRARQVAGYPAGGRHELLSVRLAETAPSLLPKDPDLRDLVLHLVASHHGYCRPFAPIVPDGKAHSVTWKLRDNGVQHCMQWSGPTALERLDSGVADRFWRLTRRYGWWGLAWLEALLRLADWRRSDWEEEHDAEG